MPLNDAPETADFTRIRYAQVWEDADVLLAALLPKAGGTYLSVASAGDNALALLTCQPRKVIALDLNPAQLHCLALRVAGFRCLSHPELLELIGSRPSVRRIALYNRCRPRLDEAARRFWDARPAVIGRGIGSAGKFERYFAIFRRCALPLTQSRETVEALLEPRSEAERAAFYREHWDHWRWRSLFRIFFSRQLMGFLGRDPSFFRYVEGAVSERILERTRHALTELAPAENPYLQWILTGRHRTALPLYLRREHFETIREHLDALEWQQASLEAYATTAPRATFDGANLSDIFEYLSPERGEAILRALCRGSRKGARLVYWNMLAPRQRPHALADYLQPLPEEAAELHRQDKAFFYSRLVIEEVRRG